MGLNLLKKERHMIRTITPPQSLIAFSLFLGTLCSFEAMALELDGRNNSQKNLSSSTDKKDPKENSSIKKLISDSITGDINSLEEAIAKKQEILRKINDAIENNKEEIVTNWTKKLNIFKEETGRDIRALEEYLEKKNLDWESFENFWKSGWGQARTLDDQPVSDAKLDTEFGKILMPVVKATPTSNQKSLSDDQPVSNTKISSDSGSNTTFTDTTKLFDSAQSQTNNQTTTTPTNTKKYKKTKNKF